MALQTKITAKELKTSFAIYECTGAYSSSNTGGWGIKNPKIENVTVAYFEITPPNALAPIVVNVFPDFPTTDSTVGYEITPSMVDATYIVSGTWKIAYIVTGTDLNGNSYTKKTTILKVFTNSAECCVAKMTKYITVDAFKDKKQKVAVELSALLYAVKENKDCYPSDSNDILTYINLQCACCTGCS